MKQKLIFGQKTIAAALVAVAGATAISSAMAFGSFAASSAAEIAVVAEAANAARDMRTLQEAKQLTGDKQETVLTQYGFTSITELNQKAEKQREAVQQEIKSVVHARATSQLSLALFVAALVALSLLSTWAATLLFKNANAQHPSTA